MSLSNANLARRRLHNHHHHVNGNHATELALEENYSITKWFLGIFLLALSINLPKFFEMTVEYHEERTIKKINDTGNPLMDHAIVSRFAPHLEPTALYSNVTYFIIFHQAFNFITVTFLPSFGLIILNTKIFLRLQVFRSVSIRLGREERKTIRATISLIAIVMFFLICHSIKVLVNTYQLVEVIIYQAIVRTWPTWVEYCTTISHILLAFNSSINLLLYCICDRHFWVIAQKKLKMWFIWPLTLRREFASLESVTLSNKETVHTTEL